MPITTGFDSRETVLKSNPYHDASGAFTSKEKNTEGSAPAPKVPRRFTPEEIQRALTQGRHDLATQMTMKNRAIDRAAEKVKKMDTFVSKRDLGR